MVVHDKTQAVQPTVPATLRAIGNAVDSSTMGLIQHQPEFVHVNSAEDAAKVEGDYDKVCPSLLVE